MMRSFLPSALFALGVIAPLRAETAVPDVTQWQAPRALADIQKQVSFGARAMETPGHVSVYQLLHARQVVFERAALKTMEEALSS